MRNKSKNEKSKGTTHIDDNLDLPKQTVFYGETPEEIAKNMDGHVPEKYLSSIMDIIKEEKEKTKNATDVEVLHHSKTEESNPNNIEIVILRTSTSTLIIPALMLSSGHLDISYENTTHSKDHHSLSNTHTNESDVFSKVIDNSEVAFSIESDIKSQDGVVPPLVIPHRCENNDNDNSISKIIDYLQLAFPSRISIENLTSFDSNVTGKRVIIK